MLILCFFFVSMLLLSSSTTTEDEVRSLTDGVTKVEEKNSTGCDSMDRCTGGRYGNDDGTLNERNCMCDSDCFMYGDCCSTSVYYKPANRNHLRFGCRFINDLPVYILQRCSESWMINENYYDQNNNHSSNRALHFDAVNKCERSSSVASLKSADDLIYYVPVTTSYVFGSNTTVKKKKRSFVYANKFCAICNHRPTYEFTDVVTSHGFVLSGKRIHDGSFKNVLDYDPENGTWFEKHDNQRRNCYLSFVTSSNNNNNNNNNNYNNSSSSDNNLSDIGEFRICLPNLINSCRNEFATNNSTGSCQDDAMAARYYINQTTFKSKIYRNQYCALCNDKDQYENLINCKPLIEIAVERLSFQSLFVLPSTYDNPTAVLSSFGRNHTGNGSLNDYIYRDSSVGFLKGANCVIDNFYRKKQDDDDDYRPNAGKDGGILTIIRTNGSRNYSTNLYWTRGNFISVCTERIAFDLSFPNVLTMLCLSISIASLLVHLAIFFVSENLRRNFSSRNLASYSFALLLAYSGFVVGSFSTGSLCAAVGLFTYYCFLVSFFWMLTISLDTWMAFYGAVKLLRVSNGKRTKKFAGYSIFCWLTPTALAIFNLWLDQLENNDDNCRWCNWLERIKPEFGMRTCWFGNETGLTVFFLTPFSVIMLFDVIFFAHTAFLLRSAVLSNRSMMQSTTTSSSKYDFRMYVRLALLTGLTWTSVFVAMYTNWSIAWTLFVALNTCQGPFILIAFSLKRPIIKTVSAKLSSNFSMSSPPPFESSRKS